MEITGNTTALELDLIYIGEEIFYQEQNGFVFRIAVIKTASSLNYYFVLINGETIFISKDNIRTF